MWFLERDHFQICLRHNCGHFFDIWAVFKILLPFHYTGWFIRITLLDCSSPSKCVSYRNGVHFFNSSTFKSPPVLSILLSKRAPHRCHVHFLSIASSKTLWGCSLVAFLVWNVLCATVECSFWTAPPLPKVLQQWRVFSILIAPCASACTFWIST